MAVLDDQITQLESALASKDYGELEAAVRESVSVLSDDIPTIKKGLDRYRARAIPSKGEITYDYEGDARKLIAKLKKHQEKTLSAPEGHKHASQIVTVNANPVSIANASASIEATFDSTMSQMWALPDDVLTFDQKQELSKMLQEVEDGKGDESKLKRAGKAVADWLFDNAIKAVPTVMPYVVQAIQGMLG